VPRIINELREIQKPMLVMRRTSTLNLTSKMFAVNKTRHASVRLFHTRLIPVIMVILVFVLSPALILPVTHAQSAIEGQVVLPIGNTWDGNRVLRPCVIYNGSLFMMWYSGGSGGVHNIGLATSSDGIAWTRYAQNPNYAPNPVLTIGSSGDWDSDSVDEAWVIYDGGQYKMWYSGQHWNPDGSINTWLIGYATSPDGIHWAKYSGNPVLTAGPAGSFDDKYVWRPTVISTGSGYMMYYRGASQSGPQNIAKEGLATSSDGIHWNRVSVITMPPGSSGWDAYSRQTGALNVGGVVKAGSVYVMGYSSIKTENSSEQIGFASSTDGTTWTPYPGNPVIIYGSSGWDSGGVTRPMILPIGDKYYVYYDAFGTPGDIVPDQIGLAMLPMSQYPIPEYQSNTLVLIATILVSIGLLTVRNKRRLERRLI
jgi:predicted GH43/DUF377 family glycosyl hydrolase